MWHSRGNRIEGHEIDERGFVRYKVVTHGPVPKNVILKSIPDEIITPKWDFENKEWKEGSVDEADKR